MARNSPHSIRRLGLPALLRWPLLLALPALAACGDRTQDGNAEGPGDAAGGRVVVLGFDGLDPRLTRQWMADGTLPNFSRLAEQGHFQELSTTTPAQSPVAWASFATGTGPGWHGIFDFLHRELSSYTPEFSISEVEPPDYVIELFGYRIPLDSGEVRNRRKGTPFWVTAEQAGLRSSVLRVPVTFPPDPVHRMLSGMGVPDLLGSQGTYSLYTTRRHAVDHGGRIIRLRRGQIPVETLLEGPEHPLRPSAGALTVPLQIAPGGREGVRILLDGTALELDEGEWSDWVDVRFSFGPMMSLEGIVRLHLVSAFPRLQLYVSPINLDPRRPAMPISSPPSFAPELVRAIGLYHTLGMPEETWSLNERSISDRAYLNLVEKVLAEREAMFFHSLEQEDSELVVAVFVQTDRVSHMFWRGLDPEHPLYEETSPEARGAVRWIYGEADRILGRTLDSLEPEDRLLVLSDHGFASFRHSVHLNRWLVDTGLMVLKPGQEASDALFDQVDWTRTKAYALGLNGLYLNRSGREPAGIVSSEEAQALIRRIRSELPLLRGSGDDDRVVLSVEDARQLYRGDSAALAPDLLVGYAPGYRASWQTALGGVPAALIEDNLGKWSGDHCIHPPEVPGVLFTSFELAEPLSGIAAVAPLVNKLLTTGKSR